MTKPPVMRTRRPTSRADSRRCSITSTTKVASSSARVRATFSTPMTEAEIDTLVGAFKSGFAKLRFGGLSERRDGSIPKMDFRRSHRPGHSRHSRD